MHNGSEQSSPLNGNILVTLGGPGGRVHSQISTAVGKLNGGGSWTQLSDPITCPAECIPSFRPPLPSYPAAHGVWIKASEIAPEIHMCWARRTSWRDLWDGWLGVDLAGRGWLTEVRER